MTKKEKMEWHLRRAEILRSELEHESELADIKRMNAGLLELYGTTDVDEIIKQKQAMAYLVRESRWTLKHKA